MKKTFILITSLILLFLFTSCITPSNNVYKVTYYIDEEVYYETEVKENEKVENIKVPEIEYYELKNWLNKETNEPYDFSLPLKGDLELVANYSKITNLAGGEEGKYYDFSNLTDKQLIEIGEKLEEVFLENVVAVPLGHETSLKLLNKRLEYPVSREYSGYELYSDFTGESVFRYGLFESDLAEENIGYAFLKNYLSKGLYSYEYKEDLSSYDLVPYFAKGEPVKMDERGYIWKIYIDENYQYSNGEKIKFEDFVEAYEYHLKHSNNRGMRISSLLNSQKYLKGECEREDVGIKYNYEEKSIIFEMTSIFDANRIKRVLTEPCTGPVKVTEFEENVDFTDYHTVGEYKIKSFENNIITFEKNPYYNQKSKISRTFNEIEYHILEDDDDKIEMVKNNLLDICSIPKELFKEYYNSEYSEQLLYLYNSLRQYSLFINTRDLTKISVSDTILFDINFRKALYYGVDREGLIEYNLIPDYYYICGGRYLSNYDKIIYSKEKDPKYKYNPELAVEYYIKSLKKLIEEEKIDENENTIIEISLDYTDDNFNEDIMKSVLTNYETLFNSQNKYSNVKIKFNLTVKEDLYFIREGDYQIGLSNLMIDNVPDALKIWCGLGLNHDFYYINNVVCEWSNSILVEFNGELFTYEALSCALYRSNNVLIRNGEYVRQIL